MVRARRQLLIGDARVAFLAVALMGSGACGQARTGDGLAGAGGNGLAGSGGHAAGGGSDPGVLTPQLNPPAPEGDGRVVDLGDVNPGFGWDTCHGEPDVRSSDGLSCADCPRATRGDVYVVVPATGDPLPLAGSQPQLYVFFDEPTTADALWFDLMRIDGATGGRLSLWSTDGVCTPTGGARVLDLGALSTKSREWMTACLPLGQTPPFRGLGIRFDNVGTLGLDALRFGPACPAP